MKTLMPSTTRRLVLLVSLVTVLVAAFVGLNGWWHQGENEDLAVWAEAQRETSWLVAVLSPESVESEPPCVDSTKIAVLSGSMNVKDSAPESFLRAAESRLLRDGWSVSHKDENLLENGPGFDSNDMFERTISGRAITVKFVRSEQPPGVTITMDPKFCGL